MTVGAPRLEPPRLRPTPADQARVRARARREADRRPQPLSLRTALFWLHLATGVVAGAVVLVMAVTGVLLTYQKQMTAWADLRAASVAASRAASAAVVAPAAGESRLPIDSLLASAVAASRGAEPAQPTAVTWRAGAGAPVEIAFGRERRVFVDARTGAALGEGSPAMRAFFKVVTDWHRWLAMAGERRETGKAITGAANLGFLFIVLSGIWLWWPRTRAALRSVVAFRRGLRGKARDFNWHNVIGAWSAIPLVVVVASATVISYPWATALVYRAYGEKAPSPQAPPGGGGAGREARRSSGGLDALVATATRIGDARMPGWRTLSLTLPTADTGRVSFTIDRGTGGEPQKRATLALDRATGAEAKWEPFARLSPARRARSLLRFAHTGEVLGLAGQTAAGLVSLGTAFLVWTGIALALRRLVAWRGRRARLG
jgi:uncharacterized iron-regulated membrane protein